MRAVHMKREAAGFGHDRGDLIVGIDVGPRPARSAGYQAGRRDLGARIEALKPAGEDPHHAETMAPKCSCLPSRSALSSAGTDRR